MRDINNLNTTNIVDSTDIPDDMDIDVAALQGLLAGFIGYDRDRRTREAAIGLVVEEAGRRPSFDISLLKERLDGVRISVIHKCAFIEKRVAPEIREGRFDRRPIEDKGYLSSRNLFRCLDRLGVEDDSPDGYGLERVDYYLNAVWRGSAITIEEIHGFTERMVVWLEARQEWRKASKVLELCRRSKILGARMDPAKALEEVERDVGEDKRLDKEIDSL